MKKILKIIVDILMLAVLIVAFIPTDIMPPEAHGFAGIAFAVLFTVHIFLNRQWLKAVTKALFKGKANKKSKWQCIVDLTLIVVWVFATITGFLSVAYTHNGISGMIVFKYIHIGFAIAGTILIVIHIFQHLKHIKSYFSKKKTKTDSSQQ